MTRRLLLVVNECSDIDLRMGRDLSKHVIHTDAVAAVWRIGQTLRQDEDAHP